jgi:predicted nucleic acid-binding protein
MPAYCVDASVVMAWLLEAQVTQPVEGFWAGLREGVDEVHGPQLLYPECTSVIREQVAKSEISHDNAVRLIDQMLALPIQVSSQTQQFLRALELAERFRRAKAYDMQYLAVAQLQGAELLTLDRGLFDAASQLGVPARLLA